MGKRPLRPATMENRKEACRTYIDQTKLVVALASGFMLSPAVLISYVRNDKNAHILHARELVLLIAAEALFVFSILCAYIVLGAVAGEQDSGTFDVYRPVIRGFSIAQLFSYTAGLCLFSWLLVVWASGS